METGRNCAYNVTRNALLSDRVVAAGDTAGPGEVLSLVLKGPGIDRQSGVWVRGGARLDLPRAIDFDVTYLDDRQRIIAAAGVGLGTDFPPIDEGVASLLILAHGRLAETGTIAGDQMRICGEAELAVLLKTASQSSMKTRQQATAVEAGASTPPAPISFQVSRLSEFVFEPFAGSLMYLPQADASQPQSSEYFLARDAGGAATGSVADDVGAELPATADAKADSGNVVWEREKKAEEEQPSTQEEPHFYAPKPVRFFDPSSAAGTQDESQTGEPERPAARESIHLSPELKAAILQIDEELRRNREKLEERGKAKRARKEKRRNDRKDATKETKQQEAETVSPEPVEVVALPELVAADTAVVGEAGQEAPVEVAPATVEAEREMAAGPAASEMQELPVEVGEEPASAMQPEPVLMEGPAVEEEVLETAMERAEVQDMPVEAAQEPEIAGMPEVQELPVETEIAAEPESIAEPLIEVSEAHVEAPVSAVAEVEELTPEEVELQLEETLAATQMALPAEHEIEPVALASSAAASPIAEQLPVQEPVQDQVTEIKRPRKIKEPKPPVSRKPEPTKEKLSLGTRLQRWIGGEASLSGNRRRGERVTLPGMVAFYWSGGAPKPHEIVNISKSGFYLRTKEFWLPDTMVRMRLERPHETEEGTKESISVLARVVRIDEDGVGHEFVTSELLHALRSHEILPKTGTNRKELERFLGRGSHSHKG